MPKRLGWRVLYKRDTDIIIKTTVLNLGNLKTDTPVENLDVDFLTNLNFFSRRIRSKVMSSRRYFTLLNVKFSKNSSFCDHHVYLKVRKLNKYMLRNLVKQCGG